MRRPRAGRLQPGAQSAVYLELEDEDVDGLLLPDEKLDLLDSDDDVEVDVPDELLDVEALSLDEPPFEEPLPLDFADEPLSEAALSEPPLSEPPLSEAGVPLRA